MVPMDSGQSVILPVHRPVPICAKRGVFSDTLPGVCTCMRTCCGISGLVRLVSPEIAAELLELSAAGE